jgi:hypothetical protein
LAISVDVIELNITKPFRQAVTPAENIGRRFVVVEADPLSIQYDDFAPPRRIANDADNGLTRSLLNGFWVAEQG